MVEMSTKLYKMLLESVPTLTQLLNGIILRDKTVSKAGKTSAVIFVPKYMLGQRVKVILIPEDSEVAGLRQTIDKKAKKIHRLSEDLKKLKAQEAEAVDEVPIEEQEKKPELKPGEKVKDLEDEDAY